jgi:hypothetical protein
LSASTASPAFRYGTWVMLVANISNAAFLREEEPLVMSESKGISLLQ